MHAHTDYSQGPQNGGAEPPHFFAVLYEREREIANYQNVKGAIPQTFDQGMAYAIIPQL